MNQKDQTTNQVSGVLMTESAQFLNLDLSESRPTLTDISGLEHLAAKSDAGAEATRPGIAVNQAVLYLRVSTERQMHTASDIDEDGNSIGTQRQATLAKVRALKSAVAEEFVEAGASAQTIAKRPVFQQMLRYIDEHPEVGYVVIYMRSRVFRNFTDAAVTKRALLEKGVRLISAKEEFGEGYMADAMEAITDIMNEVQVRQSGEDIKVKLRHKVENGGSVGRAKLGYLNVRRDFGGRLVNTIDIDPERAPLIKWAFEAYATGDYTLIRLQRALADLGLTSRPSARFKQRVLSRSQLSNVLHDPYYAGIIRYKGELYPGRHDPLISKAVFLKVQDVLAERAKRGQRDRTHHHYLKGLLFCGRCTRVGRTSRLVFIQVMSKGLVYDYFICRGRQEGVCDLPSLPVAEVEGAVARSIAAERLAPDFSARLRGLVRDAVTESKSADRAMRDTLAKQVKVLDTREERLLDLASDGQLNTPKLKARLQELTLQRASLQERLDHTDEDLERGAAALEGYLDLLDHPGELYDQAPEPVRRRLLEAFYRQLLADIPDRVEVTGAPRHAIQDLRTAAEAFRSSETAAPQPEVPKRKNPRPETGALAFGTSLGLLADLFKTQVLSKTDLVAGTGFEPATSGL